MMTREDMMRELELLPVWRLRTPLTSANETSLQDATPSIEASDLAKVDIVEAQQPLYCFIQSEEGDWLFVLASVIGECSADEKLLLRNIFSAMKLKVKPTSPPRLINDILLTATPKLVVAMGETVAQSLLQSAASLEELRGSVHELEGVPMVATFDAKHLLSVLGDKPKAWDDLCLAMETLESLKNGSKPSKN